MIKVEANQQFTLDSFEKIKDTLVRASARNKDGEIYKGDTFICDREMADYLTGKNERGYVVVDIIEVIPKIKCHKLDEEKIIPLDEENAKKIKEEILKSIAPKKRKASKK